MVAFADASPVKTGAGGQGSPLGSRMKKGPALAQPGPSSSVGGRSHPLQVTPICRDSSALRSACRGRWNNWILSRPGGPVARPVRSTRRRCPVFRCRKLGVGVGPGAGVGVGVPPPPLSESPPPQACNRAAPDAREIMVATTFLRERSMVIPLGFVSHYLTLILFRHPVAFGTPLVNSSSISAMRSTARVRVITGRARDMFALVFKGLYGSPEVLRACASRGAAACREAATAAGEPRGGFCS